MDINDTTQNYFAILSQIVLTVSMNKLDEILHKHGLSLTAPRKSVFNLLSSADMPMSIAGIKYELRTIDRATIYRTIETFEDIDVIKRVWFGNRDKYELSEKFKPHHHHLVCTECGLITKVDSKELEKIVRKIAKKSGYQHTGHIVEIFGKCDKH